MNNEPGPRVLPGLAALALCVVPVGLPINDLPAWSLLAAAALLVFTGIVRTGAWRWLAAAALALLVLAQHIWLGAPRIEEGHNVVLIDGPGSALERGLPAGAFRAMAERFDAAYPVERRCERGAFLCWRPGAVAQQPFAFAADGALDRPMYSRRVAGIDFSSPIWLRLGFINDGGSLNFVGKDGDVERLYRDRRSLAIFNRWHLRLPYFVMYRFPADFTGANLCWRGEVLWEGANGEFAPLRNDTWGCRTLAPEDIGRRIFGISIGPDTQLAMSLDAPTAVKLRRTLDAATAAISVIGVLLLLVRWRPRRLILPSLLAGSALIIIVLTDATFIGGYRPLDGGDDGLIYSGFARTMLEALVRGDVATALRGVEPVFVFTPGMRYFRMAEFLAFGDTFLGYLSVMLALPVLVYALCRRLLGTEWAIVFALGFTATPAGLLFGTSFVNFSTLAARGFADPLAVTLFLAGLLLLAGRTHESRPSGAESFFASLFMALAVLVRPNLAPAVAVMLGGTGLIMLFGRQWPRLVALCLGFVPVFSALWHNQHFGGALVPFSDTMSLPANYVMPVSNYVRAFSELMALNPFGEHVRTVARHIVALLSGPTELWVMAPLHVVALAIVTRTACSGRFEPVVRLMALAVLALLPLGLFYAVWLRYHLLMWLLAAIVVAAWFKHEGAGMLIRRSPALAARIARTGIAAWISRTVGWLAATAKA